MAPEATVQEGQAEAERTPPSKGGFRFFFVLILAVLALGIGGFAGWTYRGGEKAEEKPSKAEPVEQAPIVDMKPFVVNLNDSGDLPRYLKVEFDLELRPGSDASELETRRAEIRDAIIVLLSSKNTKDLSSIEGKDRLRDEIITRANSRLKSATVGRVFFKEFIIQ